MPQIKHGREVAIVVRRTLTPFLALHHYHNYQHPALGQPVLKAQLPAGRVNFIISNELFLANQTGHR